MSSSLLEMSSDPRHWALVTGASSGLGRAMAMQLAQDQSHNVVLAARREDALQDLAAQLELKGVDVKVIAADLAAAQGRSMLLEGLDELALDVAILNAGVTQIGAFSTPSAEDYQAMVDLNISSVVALSQALLPRIQARSGCLMLVASMAGLTPLPYQAVYAGTKAFVLNFGQSLAAEHTTRPARVVVLAPGGIATEMTNKPEFSGQAKHLMPPDKVAEIAIHALRADAHIIIPGATNKLMALATKFLPRRWVAHLVERSFRSAVVAA
ncbi:MAG: SDR family NAD(P)-dependent oxidoreductase, partial [Pseudomonadota bacterium]